MAQIAIAWVLARGEDIVPLIGARRRDQLVEAAGALDTNLTADGLAANGTHRAKGRRRRYRYPTPLMAHLDRERG